MHAQAIQLSVLGVLLHAIAEASIYAGFSNSIQNLADLILM